jgi:hypothetical protein
MRDPVRRGGDDWFWLSNKFSAAPAAGGRPTTTVTQVLTKSQNQILFLPTCLLLIHYHQTSTWVQASTASSTDFLLAFTLVNGSTVQIRAA